MSMVWLNLLFYLLLCFTATSQESVELLPLHDSPVSLQHGMPVAVQVGTHFLENISRSVLMAEGWVMDHVLAHYPAVNISTIVVGHSVLCYKDQEHKWDLVLPSVQNIYYSLTRWGLQNHITVAPSFSSDCLDLKSGCYRDGVGEMYIRPLLTILQEMGSPYVVNPSTHFGESSAETQAFLQSHIKSMKNLGDFHLEGINVVISNQKTRRPSSRKLSFVDTNRKRDPFPPRPTPIAPIPGSSNPAYAATSPLPPLVGVITPTPTSPPIAPSLSPAFNPVSPPFLPHLSPMANPASPPYGPHLPPCNPSEGHGTIGAPVPGVVHNELWCVAKPSVPPEELQEALDYACGEGGADCAEIQPDGNCYFPDSLVAHASYAFNSYWQKTKRDGGTCGFGGTAILINSDPSYSHCRFVLA